MLSSGKRGDEKVESASVLAFMLLEKAWTVGRVSHNFGILSPLRSDHLEHGPRFSWKSGLGPFRLKRRMKSSGYLGERFVSMLVRSRIVMETSPRNEISDFTVYWTQAHIWEYVAFRVGSTCDALFSLRWNEHYPNPPAIPS